MHHDDLPILNTTDLRSAMARVSFERSCLDMGWDWEIQWSTRDDRDPDASVAALTVPGWLIRCSFRRPDRDTGTIGRGFGRWWWLDVGITESAVIKTMFAAAKMIVEHELLEAFKVDGKRPFDPHRSVQDLISGAVER
jgi:hypothetical protein